MSNNKFHFEFKKKTPKIYEFFSSLKFSIFYSFFIRKKVKHLNLKNKKSKRNSKMYPYFSPHLSYFSYPNFFSISLHLLTHVQKRNYSYCLSLQFIFFMFLKNKKYIFPNYNRCKLLIFT